MQLIKYLVTITLMVFFASVECPAVVDLSDNARYQMIKARYGLTSGDLKNYMIESRIHVLGWSRSNLFAYILQAPNEARDFEKADLIIQNIITDKIVAKFSWRFKGDKAFEQSINKHYDRISRLLQKFKIDSRRYMVDSNTMTELKRFPIAHRGYKIVTQRVTRYANSRSFLTRFRLKLLRQKGTMPVAEKTVYSKSYTIDNRVFDVFVLGYIPSPYTDRIAIFLATVSRGWEGKPHVIDLGIVGASLSKAFRRGVICGTQSPKFRE